MSIFKDVFEGVLGRSCFNPDVWAWRRLNPCVITALRTYLIGENVQRKLVKAFFPKVKICDLLSA